MRTDGTGQASLLMLDVADVLTGHGVSYAVIGAMAAAVHGLVRASLDADAVVMLQGHEVASLRRRLDDAGFATELRIGDLDDPIPALLEVRDAHGNRVDLLVGLRGIEPGTFSRSREVAFADGRLRVVGPEDFIAMKAYAGGPQDLTDARAVANFEPDSLDLDLLRRLAARFGRDAARTVEELIAQVVSR